MNEKPKEEKEYPYEDKCWCGKTVWVFLSKNQKEYVKDSKISIATFRGNNETPDFHEHRNWRAKPSKKFEAQQKMNAHPDTEPEGEVTSKEAIIYLAKQIENLNRILASVIPHLFNLEKE